MSEELWVRVGGGLVLVPGGRRHGPADVSFPPPGGPWEPLSVDSRLVGWGPPGAGSEAAVEAEEAAVRLVRDQRAHLLGRLGHKLRSSVLALQETARQAAYGRAELLEQLYDQAQDVARRASAIEVVALEPRDPARAVVLGAVLNLAAPGAARDLPADAVVHGSEPVLVEALSRAYEWMGGQGATIQGYRVGSWWRLELLASPERKPLAVPELGEPLVRLLVDTHLDGWLDSAHEDRVVAYLPAP